MKARAAPARTPADNRRSTVAPRDVRLYTIVYSQQTEAQRDPDTLPLDNRDNARPDWREYWPIRNFLRANKLQASAYYGFLSPKFPAKTGLSAAAAIRFMAGHERDTDVFTFSPQADMGAFFLNVFEQGETFDAGFMAASQELMRTLGLTVDLANLVMDSRSTVYSNFVVARPAFWKRWAELCDKVFALCEDGTSSLAEKLNYQTNYPGSVPRKVFVIERIASLLLATEPWRVVPYNTFDCAWSSLPTAAFRQEAVMSDALKLAYLERREPAYLAAFGELRQRVFFGKQQPSADR